MSQAAEPIAGTYVVRGRFVWKLDRLGAGVFVADSAFGGFANDGTLLVAACFVKSGQRRMHGTGRTFDRHGDLCAEFFGVIRPERGHVTRGG